MAHVWLNNMLLKITVEGEVVALTRIHHPDPIFSLFPLTVKHLYHFQLCCLFKTLFTKCINSLTLILWLDFCQWLTCQRPGNLQNPELSCPRRLYPSMCCVCPGSTLNPMHIPHILTPHCRIPYPECLSATTCVYGPIPSPFPCRGTDLYFNKTWGWCHRSHDESNDVMDSHSYFFTLFPPYPCKIISCKRRMTDLLTDSSQKTSQVLILLTLCNTVTTDYMVCLL